MKALNINIDAFRRCRKANRVGCSKSLNPMKKKNQKKLILSKETILKLDSGKMDQLKGGATITCTAQQSFNYAVCTVECL